MSETWSLHEYEPKENTVGWPLATRTWRVTLVGPEPRHWMVLVPKKEQDDWEDAAKNIALDGAGRAAWTGEAKAGLERILDLTTSEEIRAICSSLLDLDPADERYVEADSTTPSSIEGDAG